MKVIISHDVDHLYRVEHLLDGTLLKFSARAVLEAISGVLTPMEFSLRMADLFHNQWHHIDDLMEFDAANEIPSTFFFAMSKGTGLTYNVKSAAPVIQRVLTRGFDCGVHGIDFVNQELIDSEYQKFQSVTGKSDFGIRMHYLQLNEETRMKLSKTGYLFDSSEFSDAAPYRIGHMWEFPLQIMDSREFYDGKSWQIEKMERIIEKTKRKIDRLAEENCQYLTLLFHDRYFCSAYGSYKKWYVEIIRYLKQNGHSFIGYSQAVRELQ